jgi:hypothetical protein
MTKKHRAFNLSIFALTDEVNHKTYKNWGYHYEVKLADLSDEQLEARIYHVRDMYKGARGNMRQIALMEIKGISREIDRRLMARMS